MLFNGSVFAIPRLKNAKGTPKTKTFLQQASMPHIFTTFAQITGTECARLAFYGKNSIREVDKCQCILTNDESEYIIRFICTE